MSWRRSRRESGQATMPERPIEPCPVCGWPTNRLMHVLGCDGRPPDTDRSSTPAGDPLSPARSARHSGRTRSPSRGPTSRRLTTATAIAGVALIPSLPHPFRQERVPAAERSILAGADGMPGPEFVEKDRFVIAHALTSPATIASASRFVSAHESGCLSPGQVIDHVPSSLRVIR
jgi:hypothetical protein